MGSSPNQGLGWVRVPAHRFKSQSEVHGFKGKTNESRGKDQFEQQHGGGKDLAVCVEVRKPIKPEDICDEK